MYPQYSPKGELSKDVIKLPVLEGYTIEKVYLTGDMITEESEGYTADITNNEIIIDTFNINL